MVIGQHQEVEARLTHRVQKRLGRVAVVFAVYLILLAGVGRGGAEHGLQIADGEVGGGEIGSDEGEHVVEIRPAADEVGLVELLLRQPTQEISALSCRRAGLRYTPSVDRA